MEAGGLIYLSAKVGAYAVKLGKICLYTESCPIRKPGVLVMLLPLGDGWEKMGMAAVLESLISWVEKKRLLSLEILMASCIDSAGITEFMHIRLAELWRYQEVCGAMLVIKYISYTK